MPPDPSCLLTGVERKKFDQWSTDARCGPLLALHLLFLSLAGCGDAAPSGQVVAVVDGVEITRSELNHEARQRGLEVGRDPALRNALLSELVDRKLLAREAQRQQLDRDPEYILSELRSDEILLARKLVASRAEAGAATQAEVGRFITANPQMFVGRKLVAVDQITIPALVPHEVRQALLRAADVSAMEESLKSAGYGGVRSTQTWDTGELADDAGQLLMRAGAGELFFLASGGQSFAGEVLRTAPSPISANDWGRLARARIAQRREEAALARLIHDARARTAVRYHPDFEPGS